MFLVDISIKADRVPAEQADELLAGHKEWFTSHFEKGDILLVGSYKNRGMMGLTIMQADSREKVENIIAEDSYYPDYANYDIYEFSATLIAKIFQDFKGK